MSALSSLVSPRYVISDLILDRCSLTFPLAPVDADFTRYRLLDDRFPIPELQPIINSNDELYAFHFTYPLYGNENLKVYFGNRFPGAAVLRIEWTPSKVRREGNERLHQFLRWLLRRPQQNLDGAGLTRVDITQDVYGTRTSSLYVFARSARLQWHPPWHKAGQVTGVTVGANGGARQLRYYNKANERRDKVGTYSPRLIRGYGRILFPAWMRFEHQLRHVGPLSELATRRNPLEGFIVAERDHAERLARNRSQREFLCACRIGGAQWALWNTPADGRKRRRQFLEQAAVDWIEPHGLWQRAVPAILQMLRVSYVPDT